MTIEKMKKLISNHILTGEGDWDDVISPLCDELEVALGGHDQFAAFIYSIDLGI
jgi:hypothetical protein